MRAGHRWMKAKQKEVGLGFAKTKCLWHHLELKSEKRRSDLSKLMREEEEEGGMTHVMTLKKKLLNPPVELTVFYWPIPNEFSQHCRVVWCHSQCLCLSAFYLKCDYIVKLTTLTFKSQHGNEKKNLYYHLFALVVLSLTGNCRKQWKDKRTWAENMIVLLFYHLQNVQKSKCSSLLYL